MKKVPTLEVKRCFVVSNLVRMPKARKRFLGTITKKEFLRRVAAAKKKALHMSEEQLNKRISPDWPRRLRAYNACDWYVHSFKTSELGVWKRASGLPLRWTKGSLAETATYVAHTLEHNPKLLVNRSRHALPSMLASSVNELQKENKSLLRHSEDKINLPSGRFFLNLSQLLQAAQG